jgi:DNA (cytosine-5)-methyltransferase 1
MKYIDLFAGCGGLSLGFESVGFELAFAIEKSKMAGETFYHNLIKNIEKKEDWENYLKQSDEEKLKSGLYIGETISLLENNELLKKIKESIGNIDLIVGGPPCQGFSLAGKRNPKDHRNELPWQFLEFVSIFKPKAVLMENVLGMKSTFSENDEDSVFLKIKKVLEEGFKYNDEDLNKTKYKVQALELNAIHYGVPQNRKRLFLLAIREDIAIEKNIVPNDKIWNSSYFFNEDIGSIFCPKPTIKNENDFYCVKDAIGDFFEEKDKKDLKSNLYIEKLNDVSLFGRVIKTKQTKNKLLNNNLREHSEKVKTRFRLYQYLANNKVSSKLLNLAAKYNEQNDLELYNKIMLIYINNCEYPAYSPDGFLLAKDKLELFNLILSLATKKNSQKALELDLPSPTVVSIPDDVIHPIYPRTMSVREQARFQSFPDIFEFRSKETTGGKNRRFEVPQYTQVGNAVPPLLAKEIAKHIYDLIK